MATKTNGRQGVVQNSSYGSRVTSSNLSSGFNVGNQSGESWGYVIAIIMLAVIFVIALPVLGFMYMDIKKESMLVESNVRKIEKLKKELEREKDKREE